jgi:3-oxoacyl-[acyl-carrier protein] reductase
LPTRPLPDIVVPLDLEGKTALVTGGGKGIGRAISEALAGMGAKVIVNYRSDKEAAEATAASLPNATAHQADVGDPAQVEAMIKAIGRVDVLVNNAGALRDKLLVQMSPPDWEDIIRTDLMSVFATTRAALMSGMMRARWGRIVNISSIVGLTGNAGQSNYAAAKAGLIGFTKSVAREYGSRNITCNAVAPGYVRTELTSSSVSEEMVGEMVKMTPIKREGTAEEIAAAVAFLCSQRAGFITGQVLAVDGGLSL